MACHGCHDLRPLAGAAIARDEPLVGAGAGGRAEK